MNEQEFQINIEECRRNLEARERQRFEDNEQRRLDVRGSIFAAIQKVLPSYPLIQRVYLFGSVTRPGEFDSFSDVDIAVEGTGPAQYFAFWRELEEATPDFLIDVREINEPSHFSKTVRERGELVYERKDAGTHLGY